MCRNLCYFEHSLLFIFAVTGCLSISAFVSFVDIPVGITSSALGLKIYAVTSGINFYEKEEEARQA